MVTKVSDGMILVFIYWVVCMHFGTDSMCNGKMKFNIENNERHVEVEGKIN